MSASDGGLDAIPRHGPTADRRDGGDAHPDAAAARALQQARDRSAVTSTTARRHPSVRTPPGLFAYASFAIMFGGWVAFAVALIASEQTLDDVWTTVRDLPLPVEGLVWLLGFPFLIALAIWESPWDDAVRLVAIGALAVAYTYMFVPRERHKRP